MLICFIYYQDPFSN